MSWLPQLLAGRQAFLWYESGFLWTGAIVAAIGLLILIVPRQSWENARHRLRYGFPFWIRKTYHMTLRHGPQITITTPKFVTTTSQTAQDFYETTMTSTFRLSIKPGRRRSRISLNSIRICVEAETGWDRRKSKFSLDTHEPFPQIELDPNAQPWEHDMIVTTKCLGAKDSIPRIQTKPAWGVDYISIELPNMTTIQIRKGIACPRREFSIGIYY
jgi:hypothetical protein